MSNAGVKKHENSGRGTWIAKNGEVVVTGGDTEMLFKINSNGTLTAVANITNGKREDVPKELQKLMVLSKTQTVLVTGESEATVVAPPEAEPPKAEVKKPLTKEESAKVIEAAIRKQLKKPTGELTKADLEKVTRLDLGGNKLTELPKELEKLTQLEMLFLNGNQLTDVPKGLEKLDQLKKLALDGNQLTDVKGLEKLTQLKALALSNNKLTEVPKSLEKLDQLKELYLYGNQLTDVKGLEKLTQLEELVLADNPDLTKAQIAELQKALPNCEIRSNPTK